MVRNARFGWDDGRPIDIPEDRNGFSDLDDLPDDPAPQRNADRPSENSRRRDDRQSKRLGPKEERRHLAGADWLADRVNDETDRAA